MASMAAPCTSPAAALAPRPSAVTPPLVPVGTVLHGAVTMRGVWVAKIPSSLDQVSPALHA